MEKGLFLCFLLVAAWQDFRRKEVDLLVYLIFGVLAVALSGVRWMMEGKDYDLSGRIAACLPGILMVGFAKVSRGGIGMGDGLFFLVSGSLLDFWGNLALLYYSTLCCGIFCLVYYVGARLREENHAGKKTVPFLPFAVLPGIFLALPGFAGFMTG